MGAEVLMGAVVPPDIERLWEDPGFREDLVHSGTPDPPTSPNPAEKKGSDSGEDGGGAGSAAGVSAEAGGQVVVDDAAGLHGRVGGDRAGEGEAVPPEFGA